MKAYDHARWIIDRNKDAVRLLAEDLLEHESLDAGEIKALLARAGAGSR